MRSKQDLPATSADNGLYTSIRHILRDKREGEQRMATRARRTNACIGPLPGAASCSQRGDGETCKSSPAAGKEKNKHRQSNCAIQKPRSKQKSGTAREERRVLQFNILPWRVWRHLLRPACSQHKGPWMLQSDKVQ